MDYSITLTNAASTGALERLGFERGVLLRGRWMVDGEIGDPVLPGMLRSEWRVDQAADTA